MSGTARTGGSRSIGWDVAVDSGGSSTDAAARPAVPTRPPGSRPLPYRRATEPTQVTQPGEHAEPPQAAAPVSDAPPARAKSATPAAPPTSPSGSRTPAAPPAGPRRSLVVGAVAALVAVALVVVAVVLLTRGGSTPSATQRPSSTAATSTSAATASAATPTDVAQLNAAQSVAAAQAWVTANLAGDVPIETTSSMAAALRTRGFTSVDTAAANSAAANSAVTRSWLVTIGSAGASTAQVRASTPVARFGAGSHVVQVRYAVPGWTPRSVGAKLSDEMINRVTAGSGLAINPRIVASDAVRRSLRNGSLDFRAASLLALLAQDTTVTVVAITGDPAETAVGRPARRVTVKAANPAVLTRTVAGLGPRFRPGSTSSAAGATTWTWSIAVDPAQPVS